MSDNALTPADTVETVTSKAVEAATNVVDAAVKPVEAAAKHAPAVTSAATKQAKSAVKTVTKAEPVIGLAPAKRVSAKRKPKAKVAAVAAPVAAAVRKANRKAATAIAKRKYVRKAVATVKDTVAPIMPGHSPKSSTNPFTQGMKIMDTNNWFAGFTSVPGADKFQSMFADVGEKSQEVARKGQAFAETVSETARANMEAMVESTRIAAAGARDLGQEVVASTKDGVEHATAAVKTLAEAKSPTEFFQLHSDLVRASFDRMVAEGSKFTEHMVKLAGEATQPLSNRASINAEKFSELTA